MVSINFKQNFMILSSQNEANLNQIINDKEIILIKRKNIFKLNNITINTRENWRMEVFSKQNKCS